MNTQDHSLKSRPRTPTPTTTPTCRSTAAVAQAMGRQAPKKAFFAGGVKPAVSVYHAAVPTVVMEKK